MRPLAPLAAAAAFVLLAHTESPARADCAAPQTAFAPATGTALDPDHDDAVYVFVPTWIDDEVRVETIAGGRGGEVDAERVSAGGAFDAYRVALDDLDLGDADELVVRVHHRGYEYDATYPIRSTRAGKRSPGPLELTSSGERVTDAWTCSHTNAWQLTPSLDAPAYLVEYATTAEAIADGSASRVVLPRRTNALFGSEGGSPRLDLGHVSCLGATIPESMVDGPLYVRITAFIRNRVHRPVSPIYRLGDPLPEAAAAPDPAPDAPPPAPTPAATPRVDHETSATGTYVLPLAIALGLALLLGALLIARRRLVN